MTTVNELRSEITTWDRAALDNYLYCAEAHIEELKRKVSVVRQEIVYRDREELSA